MLFSHIAYTQTDSVSRSTANILFGAGAIAEPRDIKLSNTIKVNFIDPLCGKYALYYERELSPTFSLEVGLGITGRNYIGNIINKIVHENASQNSSAFSDETDLEDDDYDYKTRETNIGIYVGLMPKFYFNNQYGLDGSYLGFNLQYIKYKTTAYSINPVDITLSNITFINNENNINESEVNLNLGGVFGKQLIFSSLDMDFFIATGLKIYSAKKRDLGFMDYTSSIVTMSEKPRKITRFTFYLEAGVKFGFWWD